jgi:Ras association (RalGDS/AF-6) domain
MNSEPLQLSFLTFTRYSRLDSNAEDEEQRALIHSLFLAQQSSNERLEELEDECFLEDGPDTGSEYIQAASPVPFSPVISPEELKRSLDQGVTDRSQSSRSVHPQGKNSTRTSTLLNALLYQQEDSRECQRSAWTNLTDHCQSVIESDNLLQTWTDQRDPLAWEQTSDNLKDEEEQEKSCHAGDDLPYKRSRSDSTSLNLPEMAESTYILPENHAETPPPYQTSNLVAEPRVRRSFRVGLEDKCRTVSPAVLWKHNIMEDWRDYLLYLVYMDGERLIRLEEKPLLLFKELDKAGKKPTFMLRRKSGGPVDKRAEASVVQPGSDEGLPEVASEWAPDSGDDLPEVAPKSDEGLPEVIERQLQRVHPLPGPIQSHPHPAKARSTESFERSQQKLAKLTGLSYIPRGDASLDKPRNNSTGSTSSVNRSAITSPSRDLDTFDGDGALLRKWITPPSAAQHTQSRSRFLPSPAPVRKMKQVPWRSRSPTNTARKPGHSESDARCWADLV